MLIDFLGRVHFLLSIFCDFQRLFLFWNSLFPNWTSKFGKRLQTFVKLRTRSVVPFRPSGQEGTFSHWSRVFIFVCGNKKLFLKKGSEAGVYCGLRKVGVTSTWFSDSSLKVSSKIGFFLENGSKVAARLETTVQIVDCYFQASFRWSSALSATELVTVHTSFCEWNMGACGSSEAAPAKPTALFKN